MILIELESSILHLIRIECSGTLGGFSWSNQIHESPCEGEKRKRRETNLRNFSTLGSNRLENVRLGRVTVRSKGIYVTNFLIHFINYIYYYLKKRTYFLTEIIMMI